MGLTVIVLISQSGKGGLQERIISGQWEFYGISIGLPTEPGHHLLEK
jgi:hypothetical protein